MDDNFSDLQKLLRLKRHETPPPAYFEGFLRDFQNRQRRELIKLPLWRIVWDRLAASLAPLPQGQLAFASACAVALFAAVLASNQILTAPANRPADLAVAAPAVVTPAASFASSPVSLPIGRTPQVARALPGSQVVYLANTDFSGRDRGARTNSPSAHTRYVLDSRPVSYEAPASF